MNDRCTGRTPDARIRVDDQVAWICEGEDESLYEFDWELARMVGFFDMVMLDVRNLPNVARILA